MKTTLIACALLITSLTACRSAVNTVENADTEGVSNIIEDKRVITDGTLERRVNVTAINERKAQNGFKQIQIQLTNRKNTIRNFAACLNTSGSWRRNQRIFAAGQPGAISC